MATAGTKLGPYEILGSLGAGGMGEVYRARDPRLGREVAIKVLPAAYSADAERLRRFEQEARATGLLNHPNILAIYDIGTQDGAPYVVSELLEGETLRERLRGGPLPVRKAVDYALQMARGLAAAHDKGIVHRDLKPENLFLTRDGRVKILDFGLAKLTRSDEALVASTGSDDPTVHAQTDAGLVLGTVGYMSPEQVRGKPADHRSDLFTFGAILYEMLSGKRAFRGESTADTLSAILTQEPPELTETNRNVPPALERNVRHCLEKNPEERFQSARDVAFDLEALSGISGSSVAAVAAPALRARFRLFPVVAVVALALVAVASYFAGTRVYKASPPKYHQLTFRRGTISSARFAADGQTIVYSAAWEGKPYELFSTRPEGPESRSLGLPQAAILGISSSGEMALLLDFRVRGGWINRGRLARAPLSGGAPREVLESVQEADWSLDGSTLLVVREVGTKNRLEFPAGKMLYETSGWISHARISRDGRMVAFIDHPIYGDDRGDIAVVDLGGTKKALTHNNFGSAQGLAWSASGDEVWFTAIEVGMNNELHAVTLAGKERVVASVPGRLQLQDIARDGRVLLIRHDIRRAVLCLPAGQKQERDLSWFDYSLLRDMTADGRRTLLEEGGSGGGPNYSIYLRDTDGSPAIRLGPGGSPRFSPDGKWVLSILPTTPAQIWLLPTGAGEPRQLTVGALDPGSASWFPDGKRILYLATQPGHAVRAYAQDLAGGQPRPITPDGVPAGLLTPDGKYALDLDPERKPLAYPVDGGEPRPVAAIGEREYAIGLSADGRSLYVGQTGVPTRIFRMDVATGRREPFKEFMPPDSTGVGDIGPIVITPDGKSYAYGYQRTMSDLYLVEGLK